jgi:hypothetical protein
MIKEKSKWFFLFKKNTIHAYFLKKQKLIKWYQSNNKLIKYNYVKKI